MLGLTLGVYELIVLALLGGLIGVVVALVVVFARQRRRH